MLQLLEAGRKYCLLLSDFDEELNVLAEVLVRIMQLFFLFIANQPIASAVRDDTVLSSCSCVKIIKR